jgi:outer membrane receptor protein involved in Fe transport
MANKKSSVKCVVFLVLLTMVTVGFSSAQRLTGKIMGIVTDAEGAALPGVTVELTSPALMGGVHSEVTSEKGTYRFINLPPGIYSLVFSLKSFETVKRMNVKVSVDVTVTENITLKVATLEESVTVLAPAPLIDVTKSGMATTFSKELLEQLPSGRYNFFDVVKQAPGLIMNTQQGDEDRIVAYGSNYESSDYQLDGVDIRNLDVGSAWQWVNPEIFAEVETTGIGAPAEYGQFTGAVINIVTKSGGNKFEGNLSYYGQFQSLVADNVPSGHPEAFGYRRDKFLDGSFNLGGPVIKDKLWFFGSYQRYEDSYTAWLSDPKFAAPYIGDKAFLKFSSQIGKNHRLVGSFYYEYFDIPDPVTPYLTKDSVGAEIGHTPTWNLMYTWLISNNAFLDLKYGGWWSDDNWLPISSSLETPSHYDGYTGINSQAVWWPWMYVVSRHQVSTNLSYFAEDFLAGNHDFKVGVQYSRGTADSHGGYTGGRFYYDYNGYPYYMYEQDVFSYGGIVNSIGVFADDSWKIGDRLTVNLGIRFDHSGGSIQSFPVWRGWEKTGATTPAVPDLVKWNTVSPRAGLAFQLTSDKKTLLRASYGRYYDAQLMSNWNWPGPDVTDKTIYIWNFDLNEWEFYDKILGAMNYTIDPKLKNPYADQYSVGVERELLPDFSIGATYIYKHEKNLVGWEDRGATYQQVDMESPDNGRTYLVWNQTSALGTNDYWITQPSRFGQKFEQTYKGLIFSLTKRYSNKWLLNASLTWSRMEGLTNTAHSMSQQAMIYYTKYFGQDPNDLINARGRLTHDRTWAAKISASYSFPWGILASANYLYQTGRPVPTFVRVYPDQGERIILAEPRGRERFPAWSVLDLRLQKTFHIYKTVNLSAMLDVFNVFNSNTVISYPSNYPQNPGYSLWSDAYHKPDEIFFPRRGQIGLRLEF